MDLGFLGPNEGQRVISRHLLEAAALVPLLPPDDPIVDVGSGAGLPGLVLGALGRRMVLIESQAKRARFLRDAAAALEIDADVRHARAEDEGRGDLRDAAGGVVARALAALPVALELCLPLVRPGGRVLLPASPDASGAPGPGDGGPIQGSHPPARGEPIPSSRPAPAQAAASGGSEDADERERDAIAGGGSRPGTAPEASEVLATVAEMLGGGDARWHELTVPGADGPRWVMMVDKRRPTPDRFPRRPGVPKRRPLGGDVASVN